MVDQSDINQIFQLDSEYRQLTQALSVIDADGVITSVQIAPADQLSFPVNVPTTYMTYPAQMMTTIRQAIVTRRQEVVDELSRLGVALEGTG